MCTVGHGLGGSLPLEVQLLTKSDGFKNFLKHSSPNGPATPTFKAAVSNMTLAIRCASFLYNMTCFLCLQLEQKQRLAKLLTDELKDPEEADRTLLVLGGALRKPGSAGTSAQGDGALLRGGGTTARFRARLTQMLSCPDILIGNLPVVKRAGSHKAGGGAFDYSTYVLATYDTPEEAHEALRDCQYQYLSQSHLNVCLAPNFLTYAKEKVVLPKAKKKDKDNADKRRSEEEIIANRLSQEFKSSSKVLPNDLIKMQFFVFLIKCCVNFLVSEVLAG